MPWIVEVKRSLPGFELYGLEIVHALVSVVDLTKATKSVNGVQ